MEKWRSLKQRPWLCRHGLHNWKLTAVDGTLQFRECKRCGRIEVPTVDKNGDFLWQLDMDVVEWTGQNIRAFM